MPEPGACTYHQPACPWSSRSAQPRGRRRVQPGRGAPHDVQRGRAGGDRRARAHARRAPRTRARPARARRRLVVRRTRGRLSGVPRRPGNPRRDECGGGGVRRRGGRRDHISLPRARAAPRRRRGRPRLLEPQRRRARVAGGAPQRASGAALRPLHAGRVPARGRARPARHRLEPGPLCRPQLLRQWQRGRPRRTARRRARSSVEHRGGRAAHGARLRRGERGRHVVERAGAVAGQLADGRLDDGLDLLVQ